MGNSGSKRSLEEMVDKHASDNDEAMAPATPSEAAARPSQPAAAAGLPPLPPSRRRAPRGRAAKGRGGRGQKLREGGEEEEAPAAPPGPKQKKPKKRLRHVILELQSEVERCQAQLEEESAKRERGVAHLQTLKAIYLIVCALKEFTRPDHAPDTDARAITTIEEQLDMVRAAVQGAGGATTVWARPPRVSAGGGVPEWSGIDAPFIPARPFLERFLSMRGAPLDVPAMMSRFRDLHGESRDALARYMARYESGDGGPRDDPGLDQRLVELALDMEGPLIGALFFGGEGLLKVFTTDMETGESCNCPTSVWDDYAEALLPPTDCQDLYFEALHAWWSRESERLGERRQELGRAAMEAPEDADLQAEVVEQLEAATEAWLLFKVTGALIAHMSVCSAVQVIATTVGVHPHYATLTGVLEAWHNKRLRVRAASGSSAGAGGSGGGGSSS